MKKQILYDMHDVQTIYKKIKNDNRNVFFLFIKKTFIYLMLTVRLQWFFARGLKFLSDNFGGVIQEMNLRDEDKELLALINRELQTYIDNMEQAM